MYNSAGRKPLKMYMEGPVSLTHIDIDDEALETAKRLGRHRTKTAAVAEALRVYNERLTRAAAYDRYFELAQDWDLERAEAAHRAEKEPFRG
jgi:Arc/MetJ family transcription regulator